MLMVGADVTMLCSALLRHGVRQIGVIERDLVAWMDRYYTCARCGRVFWEGTHWQKIVKALREAIAKPCAAE